MENEKTIAEAILKSIYDKRHPIIYGLRCRQGFSRDEVIEAMIEYNKSVTKPKNDVTQNTKVHFG